MREVVAARVSSATNYYCYLKMTPAFYDIYYLRIALRMDALVSSDIYRFAWTLRPQ